MTSLRRRVGRLSLLALPVVSTSTLLAETDQGLSVAVPTTTTSAP
jgi:hypothetical protein